MIKHPLRNFLTFQWAGFSQNWLFRWPLGEKVPKLLARCQFLHKKIGPGEVVLASLNVTPLSFSEFSNLLLQFEFFRCSMLYVKRIVRHFCAEDFFNQAIFWKIFCTAVYSKIISLFQHNLSDFLNTLNPLYGTRSLRTPRLCQKRKYLGRFTKLV